ncbi:MAG: hypothetical protein M0R80_12140 [Proteobacteria bacterium]|nr:hypothetical protein [Pseudomonadota bacterium]
MRRSTMTLVLLAALAAAAGTWFTACGATDNGGGSDGDTDSDTDTDGDSDADTSIYDVRQGEVPVNEVVTLAGVIVTAPTLIDSEDGSGTIYVEEPEGGPWSGIILYLYSDVTLEVSAARGDVVTVTGQYQEFYGLSEIVVSQATDLVVTGTADVPAPAVVAPSGVCTGGADAESYESVLVSVEDVTVTDEDMGYGQFQVADALLVADTFFVEGGGPSTGNVTVADGDTFEAIHGILEFGYDEHKLSPRDAADYVGFSGGDTDTDSDSDADVTIYEIQQGDVDEDTGVILTDVVVTSPLIYDGSGFFVEEAAGGQYSGIYVHVWEPIDDPVSISVGDLVTITGTYTEFYDFSEVSINGGSDVTYLDAGTVPAPVAISDPATIATGGADAEAYEGVLVTVSDLAVTDAEADAYGNFIVDDSLWVGSLFFTDWLEYTVGDTFTSITGTMYYTYSNFILEPRTLADLVE